MTEKRAWVRRMAVARARVAVVDKVGRLINVGWLSESDQPDRVVFASASSSMRADLCLDGSADADETLSRVVPMSPEHERRWMLIHTCRDLSWNHLPDEVLEDVLRVVRAFGTVKVSPEVGA